MAPRGPEWEKLFLMQEDGGEVTKRSMALQGGRGGGERRESKS